MVSAQRQDKASQCAYLRPINLIAYICRKTAIMESSPDPRGVGLLKTGRRRVWAVMFDPTMKLLDELRELANAIQEIEERRAADADGRREKSLVLEARGLRRQRRQLVLTVVARGASTTTAAEAAQLTPQAIRNLSARHIAP